MSYYVKPFPEGSTFSIDSSRSTTARSRTVLTLSIVMVLPTVLASLTILSSAITFGIAVTLYYKQKLLSYVTIKFPVTIASLGPRVK